MKIVFVTKQDSKRTLDTEEIIKLFENSDNLNKIKSLVEEAEDRIYVSWASVEMKDKAGELIPMDDLIDQQDILLERNGPITDEHTNRVIGETLAYKVLEHPKTKSQGVLHLNRIYNHNELDDQIWKEIQSGERKGSSVGGINEGLSFGKDEVTGENVKVLEGFKQFETASVFDPCNPLALNEAVSVVAKSSTKKYTEPVRNRDILANGMYGKMFDELTEEEKDNIHSVAIQLRKSEVKKPFAGFRDFDDCVNQNQNKDNPEAYCASIMRLVEEKMKQRDPAAVCGELWFSGTSEQRGAFGSGTEGRGRDEKPPKAWFDDCLAHVGKSCSDCEIDMNEVMKGLVNDINKEGLKDIDKGDIMKKTKKQDEEPEEEEKEEEEEEKQDEEELEEKKKQEEEEEKQEEEEEEKQDDEEKPEVVVVEEKKKEEAASDIEGEEDAKQPEEPVEEQSNEEDVFKKIENKIDKKFEELKTQLVSKASTPRPGTFVNKAEKEFADLPLAIASGKKKMNMLEVHKAYNKQVDRIMGGD